MRKPGIFHPEFFYHPRPTIQTAMVARVDIYKPTGQAAEWDGADGMDDNLLELIWRSNARVQPNIDWRARTRKFVGEFDATQAVRVQVPIGYNELGAVRDEHGEFITYGPDVEFFMGYVVKLTASAVKGTESMVGNEYVVRNALKSSNTWVHNLLCDTGTKTGGQ